MCTMLPETWLPDFVTFDVTITPMWVGIVPGECGLLPPMVVQIVAPQAGTNVLFSKPLKDLGGEPPLSELAKNHRAPQNVTLPVLVLSPTAKSPPLGKA